MSEKLRFQLRDKNQDVDRKGTVSAFQSNYPAGKGWTLRPPIPELTQRSQLKKKKKKEVVFLHCLHRTFLSTASGKLRVTS